MKQSPTSSLCCSNNLLLLPISGAFVVLLGILLVILYLVTRGLTTSLYLVEGAVPSFISATVIIISGILTALLYVKPLQPLIIVVFILSTCCVILCLVQVVTIAVISVPFLSSFTACVHKPSTLECQCYIFNSRQNNSFIADDTSNHHVFKGASTCPSIQNTLKDFLYIICIIYGFALVACLFTTILTVLLWCRYHYAKVEGTECEETPSTEQGATASSDPSNSASASTGQPSLGHCERTSTESRENELRQAPNRPRGQRRPRSSSVTSSSQPSPAHRVRRHHSTTTADAQPPPERPHARTRQRPPPVLTRGGYLQGQLNGPTIPVYTLQGTNEVYISLTDLPTLQMPSLESVPAFIPELPEPDEDPPPYSPAVELASILPSFPQSDSHPLQEAEDATATLGAAAGSADEGSMPELINASGGYVNEGASLEWNEGDDLVSDDGAAYSMTAVQDGVVAFNDIAGTSSSEADNGLKETQEGTSRIAGYDSPHEKNEESTSDESSMNVSPLESHGQRKHEGADGHLGMRTRAGGTIARSDLYLPDEDSAAPSDDWKKGTTPPYPKQHHQEDGMSSLPSEKQSPTGSGSSDNGKDGATRNNPTGVASRNCCEREHAKKDGNHNVCLAENLGVHHDPSDVMKGTDLIDMRPKRGGEAASRSGKKRQKTPEDVNCSRDRSEHYRKMDDPDNMVIQGRDGGSKRQDESKRGYTSTSVNGSAGRGKNQRVKQQVPHSGEKRSGSRRENRNESPSGKRERFYNKSGAKPKTRRKAQYRPDWVERSTSD